MIPGLEVVDCRASDVLDAGALAALGEVAAEFGMLEAAINYHATVLTKLRVSFGSLTGNPGAARHASILRSLIPIYARDHPDIAEHCDKWLGEVEMLAGQRNDHLHAWWGNILNATGIHEGIQDPVNWAAVWKQAGRQMKQFGATAEEIKALARRIGDVRYEINRGFAALPAPIGRGIPLK